MAQPAPGLTLAQAALNVETKMNTLKAMAPDDYNEQQRLIRNDVELKAIQNLFDGLKPQGKSSPFFLSFL